VEEAVREGKKDLSFSTAIYILETKSSISMNFNTNKKFLFHFPNDFIRNQDRRRPLKFINKLFCHTR
jgi:hypothetical protein